MISSLLLLTLLTAADPWRATDPFPLGPTAATQLRSGPLTLNLGYQGIFENYEVAQYQDGRPYETWRFFNEVNPFLRYTVSRHAELKVGARIIQDFGGGVRIVPRITYLDDRPEHTVAAGNFRASWNPGILYQPLSADDHAGILLRAGQNPIRAEVLVSRPEAVANNQYEHYFGAWRLRVTPVPFAWVEAQGLVDHAAGFDTVGLPYRRPTEPTHQMIQSGLYGEANLPGTATGLHGEIQRITGNAVDNFKPWKPHGYYRAGGAHASWKNLSLMAEYRRVDPTFVAPQGAYEYRLRYPHDRHTAPDEMVALIRWFTPIREWGDFLIEVENGWFVEKRSLRTHGNQNRVAMALRLSF